MSLWGDDAPLGKYAQRTEAAKTARRDERVPRDPDPPPGEPDGPIDAADDIDALGQMETLEAQGARPPTPPTPPTPQTRRPRPGSKDRPLSVTQVVKSAGEAIDQAIGTVWVEGETTSVSRPSSGHIYFALGDKQSQVRAVMWRSDVRRLRFQLENGQRLLCRGRPGLYQRDGKFQLYVQYAEPAGLGAEALALEQLKRALTAEGLFAAERKRPIPALPRRIGVVTSKSGAAVRDIIRAVQRRFPVPILVADAVVQGEAAPRRIVAALRAIARTDVDVVIVGRGGGSATDLSAFNDEAVVRAVATCPVPVISAVGHEVDTTLTDLAADRRAATPTMAGEMAVPVLSDLAAVLAKEERRLHRELELRFRTARQELDQLSTAADGLIAVAGAERRRALAELGRRLESQHPRAKLASRREVMARLEGRLDAAARRRLDVGGRAFGALAARLAALSPLRVLERGYAIASRDDSVVTAATDVAVGDPIAIRLARGALDCRVEAIHPERSSDGDEVG